MSAWKLAKKPVLNYISQLTTQSATLVVRHPVTQLVSVSVFEATGSMLINPWLAGLGVGPADEVVVSVL